MYDIDDLKNLVDMAAGGRSPADLLITNAKLVDVLTGEIRETDVSVGGGKILGFSHTEAVKVVDARGAYLLPGLIDAHYRGELKVCAVNLDDREPIRIERGERIAQLVIQRVPVVRLVEVDELDETDRGAGGFGSSGV